MPRHSAHPHAAAHVRAAARCLLSRLAVAGWLLALVLAPTWGRLHQVVHANGLSHPAAQHGIQAGHPDQGADYRHGAPARQANGLLERLLAGHAPTDCPLLDQLVLADALQDAALDLPAAALAQSQQRGCTWGHAVAHVALFHARGPPAA